MSHDTEGGQPAEPVRWTVTGARQGETPAPRDALRQRIMDALDSSEARCPCRACADEFLTRTAKVGPVRCACPLCRAAAADAVLRELGQLVNAATDVLADHDERVRCYPEKNEQPNKVRVMERLRAVLAALAPEMEGRRDA